MHQECFRAIYVVHNIYPVTVRYTTNGILMYFNHANARQVLYENNGADKKCRRAHKHSLCSCAVNIIVTAHKHNECFRGEHNYRVVSQ